MSATYPKRWLIEALRAVYAEAKGREMELPFVLTATDINDSSMSIRIWSFEENGAEILDPGDEEGLFFPITLTIADQVGAAFKATFNCSAAATQ